MALFKLVSCTKRVMFSMMLVETGIVCVFFSYPKTCIAVLFHVFFFKELGMWKVISSSKIHEICLNLTHYHVWGE